MKTHLLLLFVCIALRLNIVAQEKVKSEFVSSGEYLAQSPFTDSNYYGDSLQGFDEVSVRMKFMSKGIYGAEYLAQLRVIKRNYIVETYHLNTVPQFFSTNAGSDYYQTYYGIHTGYNQKGLGSNNSIHVAPCVNEGFEATPAGVYSNGTSVSGWTLYSGAMNGNCGVNGWAEGATEFEILTTPISGFPTLGTIPHSPLGGTRVAHLNNFVNNTSKTKIATTFSVTSANTLFRIAFAGVFQIGSSCCDAPGFHTSLTDCNNNPIACGNLNLSPACASPYLTFSTTTGVYYTNWQVKSFDLSPYIGSCVKFACWCTDNSFGGSWGSAVFDASCGSAVGPGMSQVGANTQQLVNFCPGSPVAQISAPLGYSTFSWVASGSLTPVSNAQSSLATITITNPVPGGVYTVYCVNPGSCTVPVVYTLTTSQINIFGTGATPTCTNGALGTASVQASGSSLGYNYLWINNTNSVVGTTSAVAGLAPGIYTVSVGAPSSSACGLAQTIVMVPVGNPPPNYITSPFCGTANAYLYGGTGSNFQWYNGSSPISGTLGAQANYVVSSPTNTGVFSVAKNYLGCRDSTIITLVSVSPGTVSNSVSGNTCPGTIGASVVVNYTAPPSYSNASANTFTVQSISFLGGPAYLSSSTVASTASSYTAVNLFSGYNYSVIVFDGYCRNTTVVGVSPLSPSFNISMAPLAGTVCSGNNFTVGITPSNMQAGYYNYLWTPSTFLAPGSSTSQIAIFNPTISPGNSGLIIYTVVVTPTLANCPVSTTYALPYTSPVTPSIATIPAFCKNAAPYTISASPNSGTLYPSPFVGGVINPSQLPIGTQTLGYATSSGTCQSQTSVTFVIHPLPSVIILGNTQVCARSQTTLHATGANSYTWSNGQQGSSQAVIPMQNTTYSVIGTSTLGNCQSSSALLVTVIPHPSITVTGQFTICSGETTTLIASGANSYTWNNGSNASMLVVSPSGSSSYFVQGTDASTGCVDSLSTQVKVNECTAIVENKTASNNFYVYPNPFKNVLTIEFNKHFDFKLYNGLGQLIVDEKNRESKTTFDFSLLSEGIYYLHFISGEYSSFTKVIKVKATTN